MSDTILAQGDEDQNFLLPNGTFFVELIIVVIVLGIMWRVVVPPIQKAMQERHDRVQQQLDDAERAKKRFAEADQRYRDALSEARNESAKIRDEARQEGNRIIEELRESADAEVAEIRQRGEAELAEQRDRVVNELRDSVGGLSATLASRVVGTELAAPLDTSRVDKVLGGRADVERAGGLKGDS